MEIAAIIILSVGILISLVIVFFIFRNNRAAIEITPEKYDLNYGDSFRGEVELKLYKPLKVKKLRITLKCDGMYAEELKGYEDILEENKSLPAGETNYDFYLELPYENKDKKMRKRKWYIYVELEGGGFKNSKKVEINVK